MKFNPSLHKLSNGLTVILDPMDLETVAMQISFKTGGRDESLENSGITHFMEHMFMKGTPRLPSSKQRSDFIENHGGAMNAMTLNRSIVIHGRIISDNANVLVDVIADCLQNAMFSPDVIENEKKVILDEWARSQDNQDRRFDYFSKNKMFCGSGYANETLGAIETIKSFTREQLMDWRKSRLSAKNAVIAISGKIDNETKMLNDLENLFGWMPSHDVSSNFVNAYTPAIAHRSRPDKNVRVRVVFEDKIPFGLEYRFNTMCHNKFSAALEKRLIDEIRLKNGLVYGCGMNILGNEGSGVNFFSTSVSPENIKLAVELAAKTSADMMLRNQYNETEHEQQRQRSRLSDADWIESQTRRNDRCVDFYQDYGMLYNRDEYYKMRESITVADVIENTRDFFDGTISVITQGADVDPEKLRQIWIDNFK
jgi:predicted Zn-dependent peptidase